MCYGAGTMTFKVLTLTITRLGDIVFLAPSGPGPRSGSRVPGCRVPGSGSGFRVPGPGFGFFGFPGSGSGVPGSGFRVPGFRVSGPAFRVPGWGGGVPGDWRREKRYYARLRRRAKQPYCQTR